MMSAAELDVLTRTERSRLFEFAVAISLFAVLLSAATALLGVMLQVDLRAIIVLWCVSAGLVVGLLLVWGIFRIWGKLDGAENERMRGRAQSFPEYEDTPSALPVLPATLPTPTPEIDTIRVTRNGVGEDMPRKTLHGFDPRDLDFLFRLMARGYKFTEAQMEKMELPYSREPMGKAQDGTVYTRFMELCVEAGIITGREPKKSGTLAVLDPFEMVRRIKELPESIDPARAG